MGSIRRRLRASVDHVSERPDLRRVEVTERRLDARRHEKGVRIGQEGRDVLDADTGRDPDGVVTKGLTEARDALCARRRPVAGPLVVMTSTPPRAASTAM